MTDAELHSPPPDDRLLLMLEPDGEMTTRTLDAARFWIGRATPVMSRENCIGTVAVILRVVEGKETTDAERAELQCFVDLVSRTVKTIVNRFPTRPPTKNPDAEVKP